MAMKVDVYAFTYPAATKEIEGYFLVKIGDARKQAVGLRIDQQGASAEWQKKIVVGTWLGLKHIKRDYDIHNYLNRFHYKDGRGNEWFAIPATTIEEAKKFIDDAITHLEGRRVRPAVVWRSNQSKNHVKAMDMVDQGKTNLVAYFCPRFGKTLWALGLFNLITKKYKNRVMLLPTYWLSSNTSFRNEVQGYTDFADIVVVEPNESDAEEIAHQAIDNGKRIVVPISLHGSSDEESNWSEKHRWIRDLPNTEKFVFCDEADFGSHTPNQVEKLRFLIPE